MQNSHNLPQIMALLGLTLVNVVIVVGLFPNGIPVVPTTQIFALAVIEIAAILLIRQHSRPRPEPGSPVRSGKDGMLQ